MTAQAPAPDYTQEIRFAVVMYGGVSLAIYMNGVAQELLRMVRATAPGVGEQDLSGTEKVYRKIGGILYHGRERDTAAERQANASDQPQTRFVVDVLSGTSAGGINAVYLAKALALGSPSLDRLERMWLEEADFDKLLNDSGSEPAKYPPGKPKASLLNSQRMYAKLLEAFDRMDEQVAGAFPKPLVNRMDLFVPATDLSGLHAPIRLTDQTVQERIHKMVFRFRLDDEKCSETDVPFNDFQAGNNPMLAFAARCTSSFPAAFEPVQFTDFFQTTAERDRFARFFGQYHDQGAEWERRPFADGGYLDNKPFTHAIEAIEMRDGDRPVKRKLLYLEPSPELLPPEPTDPKKPDFLANTMLAAFELPRYETIRTDIQLLNQYNRTLQELKELRKRLEERRQRAEFAGLGQGFDPFGRHEPKPLTKNYRRADLADMMRDYGETYLMYHHLKVFAVTDRVARIVTLAAGFNASSDEFLGIRYLVKAWRTANFSAFRDPEKVRRTENNFVLRYDLDYRLRRLSYLRNYIDQWLELEPRSQGGEAPGRDFLLGARDVARRQLRCLRRGLEALSAREGPVARAMAGLLQAVDREALLQVLNGVDAAAREKAAARMYERVKDLFKPVEKSLSRNLFSLFGPNSSEMWKLISEVRNDPEEEKARQFLNRLYRGFEQYDMLTLPYLEGSDAREFSEIEVFRVSPIDGSLGPRDPRDKLGGQALGAFGAFLSLDWRKNDIMWGRLDGAERIIHSMLVEPDDLCLRTELTAEAWSQILAEELGFGSSGFAEWARQTLRQRTSGELTRDQFIDVLTAELGRSPWAHLVGSQPQPLLAFVREGYRKPPGPPPDKSLEWIGRSARILGAMFDGLPSRGPAAAKAARALRYTGLAATGVVTFLMPRGKLQALASHWLWLGVLASALLIVGGVFIGQLAWIGWVAAGFFLLLMLVKRVLADRLGVRRLPVVAIAVVWAAILLVTGALAVSLVLGFGQLAAIVRQWLGY